MPRWVLTGLAVLALTVTAWTAWPGTADCAAKCSQRCTADFPCVSLACACAKRPIDPFGKCVDPDALGHYLSLGWERLE